MENETYFELYMYCGGRVVEILILRARGGNCGLNCDLFFISVFFDNMIAII